MSSLLRTHRPGGRAGPRAALVVLPGLLALAGCATLSADGGTGPAATLAAARTGHAPTLQRDDADARAAAARVEALLREPLTADAAVEIAFLANRHVQARLAALGRDDAARVRAGRLPNPSIDLGRLAGGGVVEVDRAVTVDLLALLALPATDEAGRRRLEIAQLRAATDLVQMAAEARRRFVEAVAAAQLAACAHDVLDAAQASGELAARMAAAGHVSELARLRADAFRADAVARAARADARAASARERLVRALGVADPAALHLPDRLPELPAALPTEAAVEQAALDGRLDVLVAAREAEATAQSLGLVRTTSVVNVLELGAQDRHETGQPVERGATLRFELPLFDGGAASRAEAEAAWRVSLHRAAAVANDARSQARERDAARRAAWDLARHYRDEVVPMHRRLADEALRRYNGMLIDVFDLLADARDHVDSVAASIEAQRDYWLADVDLAYALQAGDPADDLALVKTDR
jgi:outer membrane protein TolC